MIENARVQEILLNALKTSPSISFRCEVFNPKIPGIPDAYKCIFQRYIASDGKVFRRLEGFNEQGKEVYSYVENRDGQFGMVLGHWVKLCEILPLWYFDAMAEGLNPGEFADCIYTVKDSEYQGVPCYEVTVRNVPNYNLIIFQVKEMPVFLDQKNFVKTPVIGVLRPVSRVFLIGKDNSFIFFRTHFSVQGKKVYERNVGIVEIGGTYSEKDFRPSGKIVGDYLFQFRAEEEIMNKERVAKRVKTPKKENIEFHPWYTRFADFLLGEGFVSVFRNPNKRITKSIGASKTFHDSDFLWHLQCGDFARFIRKIAPTKESQ